jgi:nucleotide-binding universal stress UspA family protein
MEAKLPLGCVVVGVDGSPQSLDAVDWAVDHALLDHRPLVIAHAAGNPPPHADAAKTAAARQARRINGRRQVEKALARAVERAPGLGVDTLVRATTPQHLLVDLARQAHLVVVGSRGLGPIGTVALRSVSVSVASGCDTPVVVVRLPIGPPGPPHILVGTDGTSASSQALEFAFAQASKRRVPLTVVHCTSDRVLGLHAGDLSPEEISYHTQERLRLAEAVGGFREIYPDVKVKLRVARGPAAEYLVGASAEADLVVVGARGHHALGSSFLGSVSQRVVEQAACSVAVVHPLPRMFSETAVGNGSVASAEPL